MHQVGKNAESEENEQTPRGVMSVKHVWTWLHTKSTSVAIVWRVRASPSPGFKHTRRPSTWCTQNLNTWMSRSSCSTFARNTMGMRAQSPPKYQRTFCGHTSTRRKLNGGWELQWATLDNKTTTNSYSLYTLHFHALVTYSWWSSLPHLCTPFVL